ncbi:hypothetical protein C8N35_102486 [Breoghania corrubedonensis]|uniref:Uncharacterized protein n=1 Tax=Breoghania corrubedonensis TaxID=665038 RepID=A0A2T5VDD9_9HYPH|nr:hypothetical protein [Breoghania corrubedonensis]PTW61770.1 hypothetical protein C8N35_102486 [Breoghania corrubedonensis]
MTDRSPALQSHVGVPCARRAFARACALACHAAAFLLLLIVALIAPVSGGLSAAQAADRPVADVEALKEDGFGRIVITFRDRTLLPAYDARISSGVLSVTFPEPVDLELQGSITNALSDYVSVARLDPDGSGLRLALSGDARINTMEAGEKLFVDVLPANWSGMPPSLPDDVVKDLAKRAEAAIKKLREMEQAALGNRKLPGVVLRVGEHPTFTRLVFEWTVPFDSQFVREGDVVKVLFNHAVDLDISDLKVHLPPGVVDATSFKAEDRLNFLLRVNPSVDIRAFREGDNYVIDVVNGQVGPSDPVNAKVADVLTNGTPRGASEVVTASGVDDTPSPADDRAEDPEAQPAEIVAADALVAAQNNTPSAQPQAPASPAAEPAPTPAVAPAPAETKAAPSAASAAPAANDVPAPAAQAVPSPAQAAAAQRGPEPTPVSKPVSAPEKPAVAQDTPAAPQPEPAAPKMAEAPAPAPAEPAPAPVAAQAEPAPSSEQAASAPAPARSAPPAGDDISKLITENTFQPDGRVAPPPASLPDARPNPELVNDDQFAAIRNFVSVEARRIGDTVRVVFPFLDPVSSAVFRRGDTLWLIFDTDVPIDLGAARTALKGMATSMEIVEHGDWQAVRVRLSDRVLTTVGTDGPGWILTIGEMILEPTKPVEVNRNMRGNGGSILRIPFGKPIAHHTFTDPVIGDKIEVVTGFGPARGLIKGQSFVDLATLASAHGIALVPHVDDLDVVFSGDDVLVQRKEGGLSLSGANARGGAYLGNGDQNTTPSYGDLTRLVTNSTTEYVHELRRREQALAALPEAERGPARLDLAQFQVANSFAAEALGMLDLLKADDPAIVNDPVFNLTSGAANVIAARAKEALSYLEQPVLEDSPDAAVWRMMADVALNKWADARVALPRAQTVIGNYPANFQAEFNLSGAKALVELNDFGAASGFLSELDPNTLTKSQAARYDVLRGRVADAAGRSEEALRAFDIVARSSDRPRAAEATYRMLRIRYRDGGIDAEEAKKRLEGLTTIWRGDETELKSLRFLAQLAAENGDYREAFEAMRAAVEANPSAQTTRLLQEEMNAVFSSLFLDGKADEMEPIDALALYYDFRALTPIGADGDEMVRRLADRLISVDLLDQAAELLQYQVDHRLKGVARAQIAADLALVYLLDRQPERALSVLNRTRQAQLPKTLDRQRRLVEARALADTDRADLAIELVSNLRGPEVDRLRADTLWQAKRWQEAGEQLERMHGVRWSDDLPLEDQERLDILRAAIAYSFAGDQLGLNRLRSKYVAKMANSPSGAAFEVVTRPIASKGVEFMSVVKNIAAVDTMESFLTEYRRHYMNSDRTNETPVGMAQSGSNAS